MHRIRGGRERQDGGQYDLRKVRGSAAISEQKTAVSGLGLIISPKGLPLVRERTRNEWQSATKDCRQILPSRPGGGKKKEVIGGGLHAMG